MKTRIFQIILTLHISGLVIMAGTTFIDYVTFQTFSKLAVSNDKAAVSLLPLMSKYGTLVRMGAAILIVTGIVMLLIKAQLIGQLWFKLKITFVVLLILNGVLIGNPSGIKFRKIITDQSSNFVDQTAEVRTKLNRFYLSQLALFVVTILASVTKVDQPH